MSLGNGYLGSNSLEDSGVGNREVLPSKPTDWTTSYQCGKFDFLNDQECIVLINNETTQYLRANQGFSITTDSKPIHSFIIVTPNVSYNYSAEY